MKLKRSKVVMLPANENHHPTLLLNPSTGRMERPKHEFKYPASEYKKAGYECYDLYFIGYDEVTKPCWVFNENGVGKENKLFEVNTDTAIENCAIHNWNEVVASSASLSIIIKSTYIQFGEKVEETKVITIPQPSYGFISRYINLINKGELITFVNIEYTDISLVAGPKVMSWDDVININERDNTITIRSIKDSWTRNEVIKLINKISEEVDFKYATRDIINQWIEINL